MSSLTVGKFGGTSVATGHSFGVVGKRIKNNDDMRVITVSGPGKVKDGNDPEKKLPRDPVKVTDRLIAIGNKAKRNEPLEEDITAIEKRFQLIEDELDVPERVSPGIKGEIEKWLSRGDDISAMGEYLNAPLFASYLRMVGVNAIDLDPQKAGIVIREENGRRFIDEKDFPTIAKRVGEALDNGHRVIIPGFGGPGEDRRIITLARGGTDYTGSVLGAALNAGLYQNCSDVDGISVVEPSIASSATIIRMMTHRELTELTLGGAFGVFQYEAAVPLAISGVPTQVLNTFDETSQGTYIVPQKAKTNIGITGIAYRGDFVAFEVVKYGSANTVGFYSDMVSIFTDMGISFDHAPSSTNDVSIIVSKKNITKADVTNRDIVEKIRERLKPHDIKIHELSAVAIVGEGLSKAVGLGKRIFEAVGEVVPYQLHAGITHLLWMENGAAEKTARALHNEFFGNDRSS